MMPGVPSNTSKYILLFFILIVTLTVVAILISWYVISQEHFQEEILSSEDYTINEQVYTNNTTIHQLSNPVFLLKNEVVTNMRDMISKMHSILQDCQVGYFCGGSLLLGAYVQKTIPLHYDDEMCLFVNVKYKSVLLSIDFNQNYLQASGLELTMLGNNTSQQSAQDGCFCKIKTNNKTSANLSVDVYFFHDDKDTVSVVNGWKNYDNYLLDKNKQWPVDDVLPIATITVDNMNVCVPSNIQNVLQKFFKLDHITSIYAKPLGYSHAFANAFMTLVWNKHK